MEKNERLAWRTKPRTYCRCFSSCTKRNCNQRRFSLPTANFKKQLFRAWKVVFWFSPPDTLESRQWAFQVLFQLPKARLQWETLPTGKFQKKTFQSLKSCFLIFPSRHPWEQAVSFSGAFPAAQSAVAMGDPSNWQIKKKLFRAWKVVFWFSPPENFQGSGKLCHRPTPVTCLNPLGPTKTERTPNLDGTRRGNKFRI